MAAITIAFERAGARNAVVVPVFCVAQGPTGQAPFPASRVGCDDLPAKDTSRTGFRILLHCCRFHE